MKMSTGVDAMKMPLRPPMMNDDTKAMAWSIAEVKRIEPRQSVPSQLNVLMADGTAITMVEAMKALPSAGFMPLWNMWWPQTMKPSPAMPMIEKTIAL